MAIFTKAEDLFELFNQSVGGNPIEGSNPGYENNRIFQPEAGLDVITKNSNYIDTAEDEYPTGVVNYNDRRRVLGTITLNNRDWWENSNYNEKSFQPYLTRDKKIVFNQQVVIDGNGDEIIVNDDRQKSNFFKFSIDAVPFVINPNTDEIIRLDRYHDKEIHSEEYSLATEGKINYYILPRGEGRTPAGNIDTFNYKGIKTDAGENAFDRYASDIPNSARGYHLFRLDWGDGTPLEHTSETKVLESSTLLEHIYEKPGFYTIKGVVMVFDGINIGSWEKFETNILINPSPNYDVDLYDYKNFATIGGISSDSVLVKSATDLIGINPITFDDEKSSTKLVENINLFDRLNIYNFLTKIDHTILNKYNSDFEDYTKEIYDEPGPQMIDGELVGCLDPQASNYDPNAERDITVGTICDYGLTLRVVAPDFGSNATNFHIDIFLVNNLEGILGNIPEDIPYFLDEPKTLQNQPIVAPNPPLESYTLNVGGINPFHLIGRKKAYQQELGEGWINYNKISSNSTTKTIQTNPTNSSNRTKTISKSQLLNAKKILIGVRPFSSSGQASQNQIAIENFSFEVEAVPHSSEEAQGLGRNLPNLSSDNVNNIFDEVTATRSSNVTYNDALYASYNNPFPANQVVQLYEEVGQGQNTLGGWVYSLGERLPVNEFGNRQWTGEASDWDIEKTKISFIELDISELQDAGASSEGGLNGTYTINFDFDYSGGGSGNTGNIDTGP